MNSQDAIALYNPFVKNGRFRAELQIDCSKHAPDARLAAGPHVALFQPSKQWIELLSDSEQVTSIFVDRPKTSDLSPLAKLKLTNFSVMWPSRVKDWSFLMRLTSLKRLSLHNTLSLPSLKPIEALTGLEMLELSGGYSKSISLPSIEPLKALRKLKVVMFSSIRMKDWSVAPLLDLTALEYFHCPLWWPQDQLALLAKQHPRIGGNWRA